MFEFIKNNKTFSKVAGINLLSKIGDRLFYTAILSMAVSLSQQNSIAVVIVSISETLPILFSFFLGTLADQKSNKVNLLINNSFIRFILYMIIGAIADYKNTLMLIFCVALLNFISDLSGNYSSALIAPFTKKLVAKKDMEQAQGLISITSQLMNVLATFLGSILLSFFQKGLVAYFNSFIFLSVCIGFLLIKKDMKLVEERIENINNKDTFKNTVTNFKFLLKDKKIFKSLCQLSLLNGFFGGLTPIFALFINNNNSLKIISNPIKISLLSGIITLSMIIGNNLSSKILKNISISLLNIISTIFLLFISISFIFNNLYLILVNSSILSLFLGIISPRFSALVINKYPTERLGGIITTTNSLLVIIPPIASIIFPSLANISLMYAYIGFFIYSLLLFLLNILIK